MQLRKFHARMVPVLCQAEKVICWHPVKFCQFHKIFELASVIVNDSVTREAITRKQERDLLKFIKEVNPKTLQYIMGHSDISVTLNIYTHVNFDDAKEELHRVANS